MTEEQTLDAPTVIVQDEFLRGEPRLEGHRIGVFHIWAKYRQGKTSEDIADEMYPHLRLEQVERAIEYATAHPDRMAPLERERKRTVRERRRRLRERKQRALGRFCPQCAGQLRAGDGLSFALVCCSSCDDVYVVEQLLSEST